MLHRAIFYSDNRLRCKRAQTVAFAHLHWVRHVKSSTIELCLRVVTYPEPTYIPRIPYAVFTRDTFTWDKCHFTIENVTQYNSQFISGKCVSCKHGTSIYSSRSIKVLGNAAQVTSLYHFCETRTMISLYDILLRSRVFYPQAFQHDSIESNDGNSNNNNNNNNTSLAERVPALSNFWNEPSVKLCYEKRNRFHIDDSAK